MIEDTIEISVHEEAGEDFAAMLAAHETSSGRLQPGQKITGTIIAVTGDSVFVDVGIKVDGIMDRKEILDAEGNESAVAGDSVEAWVVAVSPQEIRLSRSMSGSGSAVLEEARDAAIPVDGRVVAVCKGGYTIEVLGKTAFCPGSQMDIAAVGEADALIGRSMQFLVIRVENRGRNVVVSRRALLDRERRENLDKVLESLAVGDMVEGRITRLAQFGAFLELAPAVEGMIHLSELSWSRVGSADEAVTLGDIVRVKVLAIGKDDKGRMRISLSRKQAEGDPWQDLPGRLTVGEVVQGKVVRLAPFGAFVEVLPGIEGLVHLSEMSWAKRVNKPEEICTAGEVVSVKIKDVDLTARRISLSLRDAEGDPWQEAAQRFAPGAVITGIVESNSRYGIFVSLAPGITGLLPAGVLKNFKDAAKYNKLEKGESVVLTVQNMDSAARRISLVPEGAEVAAAEDTSWKQHVAATPPSSGSSMGIMAQALQKAMKHK